MSWQTALGYFTGLSFLATMTPEMLLRTAFVVHTCDAVMCWVFAKNNGYPRNLWAVFGFVFGIWAVAVLILLPKRPLPGDATMERRRPRNG